MNHPISIFDYEWYGIEAIQKDLQAGTPAEEVYKKATEWLEFRAEYRPNDVREAFTVLHEHGLPSETIKKWVDAHKKDAIMHDIQLDNIDAWADLGINANDYTNDFLKRYGDEYLSTYCLDDLPPYITMDKFINFYRMEDILRLTSENGSFNDFVFEYIVCDGDLEALTKKFISEIGYAHNWREAIIDLIEYKAPVDLDQFVACLNLDILDGSTKARYAEILLDANASAALIAKFS